MARAVAGILEPGDSILELGAGSGSLAAAILDTLSTTSSRTPDYRVLEVSAELRERQQRRLSGYEVRWLDALPEDFHGVVIANEVADALQEMGVVHRDGVLGWSAQPADRRLSDLVGALRARCGQDWPAGYVSEVCMDLAPWMAGLAASLARGLLLMCDYGLSRHEYYHPQRADGTLICHYRHRAHTDPFLLPGLQDLSAWVDFTSAAEAAVSAGLDLLGYTTQAHFLLASGALDSVVGDDPIEQARQAASLRRLSYPG